MAPANADSSTPQVGDDGVLVQIGCELEDRFLCEWEGDTVVMPTQN